MKMMKATWSRWLAKLQHRWHAQFSAKHMSRYERGPFTIGRKNWMFAKSQAGATASANIYSLVETAKANDLNPYDYLKHIFAELPSCKEESDIEKLLPWNANLN